MDAIVGTLTPNIKDRIESKKITNNTMINLNKAFKCFAINHIYNISQT